MLVARAVFLAVVFFCVCPRVLMFELERALITECEVDTGVKLRGVVAERPGDVALRATRDVAARDTSVVFFRGVVDVRDTMAVLVSRRTAFA